MKSYFSFPPHHKVGVDSIRGDIQVSVDSTSEWELFSQWSCLEDDDVRSSVKVLLV